MFQQLGKVTLQAQCMCARQYLVCGQDSKPRRSRYTTIPRTFGNLPRIFGPGGIPIPLYPKFASFDVRWNKTVIQ